MLGAHLVLSLALAAGSVGSGAYRPTAHLSSSTRIDGLASLRKLCSSIQPDSIRRFGGDAFQRGLKRFRYNQQRRKALGRWYLFRLPSTDYAFREYVFARKVLLLDDRPGTYPVFGGKARLSVVRRSVSVEFPLGPAEGKRLVDQRSRGRLPLDLLVRVATDAGFYSTPCRLDRAGRLILDIEIHGYRLDRYVKASGQLPNPSLRRGRRRQVKLGTPFPAADAEARRIRSIVAGSKGKLAACFARLGGGKAGVDGWMVLRIETDPAGRPRKFKVGLDSFRKPALLQCITAVAGTWRFGRRSRPGELHIPLGYVR